LVDFKTFVSKWDYTDISGRLNEEDAVKVVDLCDKALGSLELKRPQDVKLLQAFSSICSATIQLPRTLILSDGLKKCGDIAVASGGFTDIWHGSYFKGNVAIKAFRTYPAQDLKEAKKILWRGVVVWKKLSHENVLPFFGVDMTNFQLALVYDWMELGNITQYLSSRPEISRTHLLLEVARGLHYLHSCGVVHGDLKGSNVLITPTGHACVSDYGLMTIQSNHAFMNAATPGVVGISRWLAPELINPPRKKGSRQPAATEPADIFAFAMLAIEVFTGALPFGDVRHETAILMIAQGQRPVKPQVEESHGFTPEIWKYIQKCWNQNPAKRPIIEGVVSAWQRFDSEERLRGYTLSIQPTSKEKYKSIGKSDDRSKKTRFCGLF